MTKEARIMYERYRNEINLPARTAALLNEQGKTSARNKPFSENNIRPYFQGHRESLVIDLAIVQAAKGYESEQKALREQVREAAAEPA